MNSTIDNLNFGVIIDDTEFNNQIKKMETEAKRFNTSMSNLLNLKKQAQQWSQADVENNRRAWQAKVDEERAQEKINREKIKSDGLQRKINAQIDAATGKYKKQSRVMGELKNLALGYLSIHGATQLLSSLVRVTGEFELQKTTLAAMLGDLNEAEQVITRIQALAVESPFQFKELTTYAKQLSAFSVPAQELYDTTKMLADISAGLGVGMDRIVLAYGQVRSAAFLRGQEVRQFTEAGIPILDELAKQFTELEGRAVSAGEVFDKISARLVPFEMVAKVFKDMTSEGGKFYNMQEVQAETLRGKISNLKDAYEVMLNEIGSQKSGTMKSAVDSVKDLMQNWEKVGDILITVAHSYGLYKAAMLGAWAVEKYMAATKIIEKYDKLNAVMLAQGKTVNKLKNAWVALGASKKAAIGIGLAVIGALVTAIGVAIKDATKLRKELESIMSAEFNSSDKAVNDLDRLVSNLKKANRGSQEYRETISELNRKYGEYLPNILTEADSYEKVEAAANAAAIAIRNKAKANAFEKGSAAIEDDLGTNLTKRTSAFRSALTNMPSISKDAANEFIKNFNLALSKEGAMDDVEKTLRESFDSYFGEGKFEEYELSFSLGTLVWDAEQYAKIRDKVIEAEKDLQEDLDARFDGAAFSSLEEREKVSEIEQWYRDELSNNDNALKKLTLTQEEYNKKVSELDVEKLRKLADAYDALGRADIAESYRKQIEELTKIPDGWRGEVQKVLKDMGLSKGTSFGLWADETTQSTAFVDEMIKRYKELDEEIKMVSSFDEAQTKRLQQNKDAILAVAKALKIDIETLAADKGKSKSSAQIELETRIDLVKKLQDAYEKLMPYLTDAQMKDTLKSLFPEAKAEWLESFDFNEVLRKLADDLKKYDKEASSKLQSSIGKDVAGSLADAFKEIEAYKKMLDEWMGEDFNLAGSGVALDINKIVRDLNNQYAKIDQKRLKALELLKKAEEGDAESVALARILLGEEVWNKYLTKGKAVIEELTSKEKQSMRDVANEKIRDKATAYMKELLESRNIDLTDLADKSGSQLRSLIDRMKLIQKEVNVQMGKLAAQMFVGDFDDGQKAQFDMLAKVVEMLGLKIEDVGVALEKTVFDKMSDGADIVASLAGEVEHLGQALEDTHIESFGKELSSVIDNFQTIIPLVQELSEELNASGASFEFIKSKTKGGKEYTSGIEGTKFKELSDSAKGGIVAIAATALVALMSKIIDLAGQAYAQQQKLNDATREYAEIQRDARRDAQKGIFGVDDIALAIENMNILNEATEQYAKDIEALNKVRFQGFRSQGGMGREMIKNQSVADMLNYYAEKDGWELYRENGEINISAVEAYYDTYKDSLTKKQRKLVENLIESGNALDNAAAQQAEYLTNLFSGVADDIATSMVDAFIESGDAANGLGDVISDVSKQMVADLIKSVYLMPILSGYTKQFEAIQNSASMTPTEKTEAQLMLLDDALQQISGQSANINETLERFSEYLGEGEGGTSELGEGIKGITEDTANLLASYLNSIRADVAYSKVLWQRMDANTQAIANALVGFSAPSLMEYQAKIESNTYNNMIATQSILARLNELITYEDGPASMRVLK